MSEQIDSIRFDVARLLEGAWGNFVGQAAVLVGATAVVFVPMFLIAFIPFIGPIIVLALAGPALYGFTTLILKAERGQDPRLDDLLSGFRAFVPAFSACLLITLFVCAGILVGMVFATPALLCGLLGLSRLARLFLFMGMGVGALLAIAVKFIYILTFFYMVDKGVDFWPAMEASRTQVMKNWAHWLVLVIVVAVIHFAGALPAFLGWLVTIPLIQLMLARAYQEIEEGSGGASTTVLGEAGEEQ